MYLYLLNTLPKVTNQINYNTTNLISMRLKFHFMFFFCFPPSNNIAIQLPVKKIIYNYFFSKNIKQTILCISKKITQKSTIYQLLCCSTFQEYKLIFKKPNI